MAENNPRMPDLLGVGGPHVLRLALRASLFGQSHLNYMFYSVDADITTQGAIKTAIGEIWSYFRDELLTCLSEDWGIQSIVGRRVDLYAAPSYFLTRADLGLLLAPVDGAQGPSCPPQDAVVMTKRTTQAGKRSRGRWYFSGIAEDDHEGGLITAASALRFESLRAVLDDTFVGGASGNTYSPMHCYWRELPVPLLSILEGSSVEEVTFDPILRSQRRRQIGRGI
jgi:hypothetical protein